MAKINKYKLLPMGVVIILMLLFVYLGYMYAEYDDNIHNMNYRSNNMNELEWMFIKSIIYEDYLAAGNQAKIIADQLTDRLKDEYPDLNILKQELEYPQYYMNPKYFMIMQDIIKDRYLFDVNGDDNNNQIFICNKYGVIANMSRRARLNMDRFPLYWDAIYQEQTNLELTKNAVNMLLNQKNEIIYWEFPNDDEMDLPSEISIDNLRTIYNQYGINGFKNIQFLAPAYITATSDIFGIEDIDIYGNKTNNNKIIVVQSFNLYQQLQARYSEEITKINIFRDSIVNHPVNDLYIQTIFIIAIIIMIIILVFFMLIQNEYIFNKKA